MVRQREDARGVVWMVRIAAGLLTDFRLRLGSKKTASDEFTGSTTEPRLVEKR